jgi:RNA polymerase sigma-70 factor (ECF subfamily)
LIVTQQDANPSGHSGEAATVSTSTSLLARVRDKDPQAWERLVELYGPVVYRWSRYCGVGEEDSSDIVQEVFRAVSRAIGSFRRDREGDSFRKWLSTITRNKINDHFRRRKDQPVAEGGTAARRQLEDLPEALSADDSVDGPAKDLTRRALALLETDFQPHTWQAFWQTAVEKHPAVDVAEELQMSVAAVWKAKSRVMLRLRDELSGLGDD